MTRREEQEVAKQFLDVFAGILFNNRHFDVGDNREVVYNFDCPEFVTLREKYNLEKIAGKGSDYVKAKRLLHYLAPRLTHESNYDNHVPCNALDLLEYSFDNPAQGINCLNKAKILQECCLALGIYARRVFIMPYSPYDFDNHVVTEIYDRTSEKWIMLDPSSDGLFVDENGIPLSLFEMREKFAGSEFVTYVRSIDRLKDLSKLREKYMDQNAYICKNLFFFYVDGDSTFGTTDNDLAFVPENYSIKEKLIANLKYRIRNLPDEYKEYIVHFENQLDEMKDYRENKRTNVDSMLKSPIK